MMRRVLSVSLMATLTCVFGLAQHANAGVTIDVVFQDATAPSGLAIRPGDPGPGCAFTGYWGGGVTTGRCTDVILQTTDPLIIASGSVSYTSNTGLAVASYREWVGVGVSFDKAGTPVKSCVPWGGLVEDGNAIRSFDCVVPPPNGPPSLQPGTYRMGTIIWDTSSTTLGADTISAILFPGHDAVGAVINGVIIDISTQVVLGSHRLITPEPGSASLLGLGLVGLILTGRRSRA